MVVVRPKIGRLVTIKVVVERPFIRFLQRRLHLGTEVNFYCLLTLADDVKQSRCFKNIHREAPSGPRG